MGVLVAEIIICVIGGIAGWLASIVVKGNGMGLVGNIIVGSWSFVIAMRIANTAPSSVTNF